MLRYLPCDVVTIRIPLFAGADIPVAQMRYPAVLRQRVDARGGVAQRDEDHIHPQGRHPLLVLGSVSITVVECLGLGCVKLHGDKWESGCGITQPSLHLSPELSLVSNTQQSPTEVGALGLTQGFVIKDYLKVPQALQPGNE